MNQVELCCTSLIVVFLVCNCQLQAQSKVQEFVIIYDGTTQPNSFPTQSQEGYLPSSVNTKLNLNRDLASYTFPIKDNYSFTSAYGYRKHPVYKDKRFHKGIDLACRVNTFIYAPSEGKVLQSQWRNGYGYYIKIQHDHGVCTAYGHLKRCLVYKGQNVISGQPIGKSGNTGLSTGPHLHFELWVNGKTVNPLQYIKINN